MIYLELPFPPSVNSLYRTFRGRPIMSAKGRAYQRNIIAAICSHGELEVIEPPYDLRAQFERGSRHKYDLDNLGKALQDGLQAAGVLQDDAYVDRLLLERLPCNPGTPGKVYVWVLPFLHPPQSRSGHKAPHTR